MYRRLTSLAVVFAWTTTVLVIAAVAVVVAVLAVRGGGVLNVSFFFGETSWWDALVGRRPAFGGIWAALAGTLTLVLSASIMAIPLGVGSGIYLAEYASSRWRTMISFGVDLLSGVPSIVMGLFGFTLVLLLRRTVAPSANKCLLLAAICLTILVLPYLIRSTQSALSGLPESIRMIGPSLGFTRWQTVVNVLLPSASRSLLSGIILSIGRIAEDTAVIMLAGAVFNAGLPGGPFDKFEALPFRIYSLTSQYRNPSELEQGFGCALVLLLLTAGLFACAFWLRRSLERQWNR